MFFIKSDLGDDKTKPNFKLKLKCPVVHVHVPADEKSAGQMSDRRHSASSSIGFVPVHRHVVDT